MIFNPQVSVINDSSILVTFDLPETPPMNPDQLSILSTIGITDTSQISMLEDYPDTASHTVIFGGLTPGTYSYRIMLVLKNDTDTSVGLPVTGTFTVDTRRQMCIVTTYKYCIFPQPQVVALVA